MTVTGPEIDHEISALPWKLHKAITRSQLQDSGTLTPCEPKLNALLSDERVFSVPLRIGPPRAT